jgi:bacillithiol system protein YtxJ
MNWIDLNNIQQLADIKELSKTRPQVIFKHSTRCAVSSMAKSRLERNVQPDSGDFYFLDLIKHRSLSDKIAEDFAVSHESPQILLIKNAECVYEESHSGIRMDEIAEQIALN